MQSTYPATETEAESAKREGEPSDGPFDLNADAPCDADTPETCAPAGKREFVMGPRQIASLAFVGVLIIGIMSAAAYFAGRKNTEQMKATERLAEAVVMPAAPSPAPTHPPSPPPAPQPSPPPVGTAPAVVAKPPAAISIPSKSKAEVTTPALNRLYLQAGSLDVGVAEVMVEGLRQRGLPAVVGIGINSKVARVLIGPFDSPEQQRDAQKKIEDLGFHPFPRVFSEKDLEQENVTPATTPALATQPAKS